MAHIVPGHCPMRDRQLKALLLLHAGSGLPSFQLKQLIDSLFCARDRVLEHAAQLALPSTFINDLKGCLDGLVQSSAMEQVERDFDYLRAQQVHVITLGDQAYSDLLAMIHTPPLILYCRGNIDLLKRRQLAIVGARKASAYGLRCAYDFAYAIAQQHWVITSGLALGIDQQAHRASLDAGGSTIAVLGTGIDQVYPARHCDLAESIVQRGLLLSEFPLHSPPRRYHFPQRNRVISGMSQAVLLVEAARRSGSLITAFAALEQGREVFAVPGSIYRQINWGCLDIIAQGAHPAVSPDELLAAIQKSGLAQFQDCADNTLQLKQQPDMSEPLKQLCHLLEDQSASLDHMCAHTQCSREQVLAYLSVLQEMQIVVQSHGLYHLSEIVVDIV